MAVALGEEADQVVVDVSRMRGAQEHRIILVEGEATVRVREGVRMTEDELGGQEGEGDEGDVGIQRTSSTRECFVNVSSPYS